MPETKGYRSDRLRRRRRSKAERRQAWVLYLLAGAVAFVAVLGAWFVASRWVGSGDQTPPSNALVLIELTVPGKDAPVASALAVKDASGAPTLFVIPPDLLLEGPEGEYVFAGDALAAGTLQDDLARVINTKVDAVYRVPVTSLARLAGSDLVQLQLDEPVTLVVDGNERVIKDGEAVTTDQLAALFESRGPDGYDAAHIQEAVWRAVLEAAAVRPEAQRSAAADAIAGSTTSASPASGDSYLSPVVRDLIGGDATVALVPARSRVAEGQFAFLPDPEKIMAEITRKAPGFKSRYTVQVENGTGKVGAAEKVAEQLAVLDVNLPATVNADSFDYGQTQILAGRGALPAARDIRAILGRGVVLDGAQLPQDTVVVIVGDDLAAH